ncbi:hypothetical protein F4782DRAFT_236725 [Xylaria castorea]|nr:hypothetical protein F4782DRAFT_236725 [Xylaria castorea]
MLLIDCRRPDARYVCISGGALHANDSSHPHWRRGRGARCEMHDSRVSGRAPGNMPGAQLITYTIAADTTVVSVGHGLMDGQKGKSAADDDDGFAWCWVLVVSTYRAESCGLYDVHYVSHPIIFTHQRYSLVAVYLQLSIYCLCLSCLLYVCLVVYIYAYEAKEGMAGNRTAGVLPGYRFSLIGPRLSPCRSGT